uniref:Topoisomerase 6 subunit A/Spo11 TOPRIM domain-containing protein n=1 Tax=Timspurckia oligopyrenoides TaxID=708627 RepID=A0A7S1ES97_9RHOD|mmetsp:Transcript_3733/g.6522  ORF Transcript_3733/g.6522 Transcript_3733/m.6522 type:complete len:130 (+) Transcript_3733:1027-1416(+)
MNSRLPVLGLADWNPHGLALLMVFREGSINFWCDDDFRINLKWLGLRSTHFEDYNIPEESFEEVKGNDVAVVKRLLCESEAVTENHKYQSELLKMLEQGTLQLQAMYSFGLPWFSQVFIPELVRSADYI